MKIKEIILSAALATTGCDSHKTLKQNEGYQGNNQVVGCVEAKTQYIAEVKSTKLARFYADLINATVEIVDRNQMLIRNPNINRNISNIF